jgi:hypothetical protein
VLAKNVDDALPSGTVGEGAVDDDNILDWIGLRRGDGSRQKYERRGHGGNELGWHRTLLHYSGLRQSAAEALFS